VREESNKLFGFRSDASREWFRLLQTVQGSAPKSRLRCLYVAPSDLANAIALRTRPGERTPASVRRSPRRIVTELKDKAPAFANVDPALVHLPARSITIAAAPGHDAISALVNSVRSAAGRPAIAGASRIAGEGAETAQLIKLG